jgi:hypothetical protein
VAVHVAHHRLQGVRRQDRVRVQQQQVSASRLPERSIGGPREAHVPVVAQDDRLRDGVPNEPGAEAGRGVVDHDHLGLQIRRGDRHRCETVAQFTQRLVVNYRNRHVGSSRAPGRALLPELTPLSRRRFRHGFRDHQMCSPLVRKGHR